jgi:hypothetical protein
MQRDSDTTIFLRCLHVAVMYVTISPSHRNTSMTALTLISETLMNTQISSKFAALAAALMMNSLLIAGVAYLFNGPLHQHMVVISAARTAASSPAV